MTLSVLMLWIQSNFEEKNIKSKENQTYSRQLYYILKKLIFIDYSSSCEISSHVCTLENREDTNHKLLICWTNMRKDNIPMYLSVDCGYNQNWI